MLDSNGPALPGPSQYAPTSLSRTTQAQKLQQNFNSAYKHRPQQFVGTQEELQHFMANQKEMVNLNNNLIPVQAAEAILN